MPQIINLGFYSRDFTQIHHAKALRTHVKTAIENTVNMPYHWDMIEELIEVNRAQIEHRATWMGLIYDEMVKAGVDAEAIIRRAIKRCGRIHGENIKKRCADPENLEVFRSAFLTDLVTNTFDVNPINSGKDSLSINFNYCALVQAWKKLGFDDKTCAVLCDMAMEGDRSIAEVMGYQFELGQTIAQGCPDCKLRFSK